jgi:sporulation protein YlmC with PRC-barrel domain
MNDDRQLTIHFNNGTKMDVTFPVQIKNSMAAVLESMKKALESDKLVIEAEGKLVIIPWTSIKHIEVTPAPPAVPFGSIKGARISQ